MEACRHLLAGARLRADRRPPGGVREPERRGGFLRLAEQEGGQEIHFADGGTMGVLLPAGSKARYHFGDDERQLGDYAWFSSNASKKTHPVGLKKPNGWG